MNDAAKQFTETAEAYLLSEFHSSGPDLKALVTVAQPEAEDRLLDLGTNVGHTLRALCGKVRYAVGADSAREAMTLSRKVTEARNVAFVEADAADLPFPSHSFDLVTCRLAAHHFREVTRAFHEMARVLDREGVLIMTDTYAPPNAEFASWINSLERLRDASHVEDRTLDVELGLLRDSGLHAELVETFRIRFGVDGWLRRSKTPADRAERVREMVANAEPRIKDMFAIDVDTMSFVQEVSVIVAGWP